jgi:hypothetical protein
VCEGRTAPAASVHQPSRAASQPAGECTGAVCQCAAPSGAWSMSLFAIQELLGHAWTGTTARYIHVHGSHVEDAWVAGQQRASDRWKGLV